MLHVKSWLLIVRIFSCVGAGDLWGPLVLCLCLSVCVLSRSLLSLRAATATGFADSRDRVSLECRVLSLQAKSGQASMVFAAVFVIVWCGAGVVSLNAQLLGANISLFQSICVLGYCVFPLNLSALVCLIISNTVVRMIAVGIGFVWSTKASVVFISEMMEDGRRALAVYPVFLFYIVIAWMVRVPACCCTAGTAAH